MKTQVSRDSFNRDKRYSGVYLQQGRMITDSDWNEDAEIAKRRLDDALADAIASGVPREHGVRIEAVAGQPLHLARGRLYAGGVGALVTSTLADPTLAFGLDEQADFPLPDGTAPPAASYRLYADVWERSVTALEDPDQLRDPAFQGADTASRTQAMAQLKWCGAGVDPEAPAANPPIGDARLTLTLRQQFASSDPCDPCAAEVTVLPRVGNFLFRLEVHAVEGGALNPTRLTLKWSSENGAEAHAVGTEPDDFKGTDWTYEYFTTRTEKHLGVHLAGGIAPLAGELVEGFPDSPPDDFDFVRRWDGYCSLRRVGSTWSLVEGRERSVLLSQTTAIDADGHIELSGGTGTIELSTLTIELDLANRTFVAGDYWLADVREAVHKPGGDPVLADAPPAGIEHHYLLLATISNTGAAVAPDTNRQQRLDFPSLTSLAARDVDYAANCPSGLFDATHDTVQKALDRVCSIDATHVGFAKPCNTSIFQGVDPATINTVAKALRLLCDVRAEQISYAPDCPSGLFNSATHNTVKKALDRVCGIDATHIGFTKPCDTSVFQGVDPASVNTVAKALALLCSLRADQIAYTNDEACSALTGATTVQEALHLLCLGGGAGGGCRTTIGEGGEFPDLKQALETLLERGETRFCFCLLPGEHLVDGFLLQQPFEQRFELSLEGCGPASLLRLANEGLGFFGLASVRLSNVAFDIGPDSTLQAEGGEEVIIEGCTITIVDHGAAPPVIVAATRLVRLAGNTVQALNTERQALAAQILTVDDRETVLSNLYAGKLSDERFAVAARDASLAVAAQSLTQRRAVSSAIRQQVGELQLAVGPQNLSVGEESALTNLSQVLLSDARTLQPTLEAALLDVRQELLSAESSLAVVLGFQGGDAILADNQIVGVLALYGPPGQTVLSDANLESLRARIIGGGVQLQANEESLVLARNRIGRLSASDGLILQLRDFATTVPTGTVTNLFRTSRLTDNVFMVGENVLVCLEATLSGNRFGPPDLADNRLAIVVANAAFYLGNHGPESDQFSIRNVARRSTSVQVRFDLNGVFINDA